MWQQQGYDNYGGYSDSGYSQSGNQSSASHYATNDQASYDMFGAGTDAAEGAVPSDDGHTPHSQVMASGYNSAQGQAGGSYYNPNFSGPVYQQPAYPPGNLPPPGPSANQGQGHLPFGQGFMAPDQLMSNPVVADLAMQYGQNIMGKGQEEIKKNLDKYVSIGQLKYYFAVDNSYVGKKLGILLFPFAHNDWSLKYSQEEPVQPKYDVNAADLYIPCMAYTTYVFLVGYILGLRRDFSPDLLAITASSSLVWLALELVLIYLTLAVMSINSTLTKWDILSFSTYKYVGIIVLLVSGFLLKSTGYYACLVYISAALFFFLLRTLNLRIETGVHEKRKLYVILMYAGLQPFIMWWLTSFLASPPGIVP